MSAFIKLHPHNLIFQRAGDGSYTADLSCSIEQYGLMVRDCLIQLLLFAPNAFHSHWLMVCEDPAQLNVPGFAVFLRSLEKYMFVTLHYSPQDAVMHSSQAAHTSLSGSHASELFFDKMYFDIDQVTFQLIKD
ncbi:MAG: hypothetical protein EXR37_02730 [Limnohabitans sp.]|nr:hypothetical protein [Limnohabitans sp.]